jgi:hypothetical protein
MPKSLGFFAWKAVCLILLATLGACNQYGEPQPEQPIQFPHKVHAADNNIPCLYCHQTADKSATASIPPVSTCVNCHQFVPGQNNKAEVDKVLAAWEKKEPILWNKVHDLPDFVYFPHRMHVKYFTDCANQAAEEGNTDLDKACGLNPNQKFEKIKQSAFSEPLSKENVAVQSQYFACSQCHGPVWEFGVGKRVESLRMGWCVDCHQNRIDKAPEEQKEVLHGRMMDCWTCHK